MKAIDYLQSIKEMETRIQMKKNQVQALRDRLGNISVQMDADPVSHTRNVSASADQIALTIDIENEIDALEAQLKDMREEANKLLDTIPADYAIVLSARFIEGKLPEEIAATVYLSKRQVYRRLNDGLMKFQEVLNQKDVTECHKMSQDVKGNLCYTV